MSDRAKNLLASLDGIPMKYPESRLRTVEAHLQMSLKPMLVVPRRSNERLLYVGAHAS